VSIPASDLPTAEEQPSLANCDAEKLYFGFSAAADPVRARKCSLLQRERGQGLPEVVFGGAGLLSMIYANGRGADRNFDLAIKFACEVDGAQAENFGRFDHLLRLQKSHWTGDDFSLCDDATSGFMQGWCAHVDEGFAAQKREDTLRKSTGSWSPEEKKALSELRDAAHTFFDSSSQNEVDLSGTGRAAFEIEAESDLEDKFVEAIGAFEQGKLPRFSVEDYRNSDAELNAVYSRLQETPSSTTLGTITPTGIRTAQRAWLRYREAWVAFGKIKYPAVRGENWRTWLTLDRIRMLKDLPLE
jgi:hypothetical protein